MFDRISALRRASVFSALSAAALAASAHAAPLTTNTAGSSTHAVSLGRQAAATQVQGTVWLQLHNKAALDAAVKAMYTKGSPTYHQFAGVADLAKYAPTAADVAKVKAELAANHLNVVSVDKNNFSIKISGTSSNFESAFHTAISQYRIPTGDIVKGYSAKPTLRNSATGLVAAVTGVGGRNLVQHMAKFPIDPDTGKQAGMRPVASSSPAGAAYASDCFYPQESETFTATGATGTFSGFGYGAPVGSTQPNLAPCGYGAKDIVSLLGLNSAYTQGYKGQGQTIAIVDAYGSPTITQDLATFNAVEGLPTSSFQIMEATPFTTTNTSWADEVSIDVQWSHAVAPAASIILVPTPSNYDDDLQAGVLYIIENHLANVISNSYSGSEYYDVNYGGTQDLTAWDEICELAALEGISANFATGDNGDLYAAEGVIDVGVPADSPYATAIGGVSIAYSPTDESTVLQTGWGTNITRLATTPNVLVDPPLVEGLEFGAGGGVSQAFELPSWQSSLSATGRMLPDISSVADPYTGCEIILTVNGTQYYEVYGGTSLATPIFSAEWTLLNQAYGSSLGQAAPLVAEFANTPAITDVLPAPSGLGVSGSITDSTGTTAYSASDLIAPEIGDGFFSAIYHSPNSGSWYSLSFGTDSSLPVTTGYDNVTGWGTLNMPYIFDYVASLKQ